MPLFSNPCCYIILVIKKWFLWYHERQKLVLYINNTKCPLINMELMKNIYFYYILNEPHINTISEILKEKMITEISARFDMIHNRMFWKSFILLFPSHQIHNMLYFILFYPLASVIVDYSFSWAFYVLFFCFQNDSIICWTEISRSFLKNLFWICRKFSILSSSGPERN